MCHNGTLKDSDLILYFQRLVNKIYKLMPMKENNDSTYNIYVQKLIEQLKGGEKLIIQDSQFVEILFNISSLTGIDDIKLHNSIVKESISICQSLIRDIELKEDLLWVIHLIEHI